MATIVQGGPDLRHSTLEQGVSTGISNYFATRKKKQTEDKFVDAFRQVNEASDYETAVKSMSSIDREVMANPQAMQLINDQINRKFPEQETMEVIDPVSKQKQVINYRKGAPPSDQMLATKGLTRAESAGIGSQFAFNEETGDVAIESNATKGEMEARSPGSLVMSKDEVAPTVALKNAFSASVKAKAAKNKVAGEKKPTEFEQTVDATQQRLGLQDRNQAINVVKNRDSTIKEFREFYTKSAGGEVFFTDDIARGHITNSEQIMEPGLATLDSPETVKKLMVIDASYNIANDPNVQIEEAKNRAGNDFLRLTGMSPGDKILKQVVDQAGLTLEDGQVVERPVKDASGKVLFKIRLAKIGGRVIPLQRVDQ